MILLGKVENEITIITDVFTKYENKKLKRGELYEKKLSRILSAILVMTLFTANMVTVKAYDETGPIQKDALIQKAKSRTTENYLTIKDEATGEEITVNLGEADISAKSTSDGIKVTNTLDLEKALENLPVTKANQTVTDTLSGWRGTVTISYTDDGTWACLNYTSGNWRRVSDSYSMSNANVTYGQYLGTNSKSRNVSFGSTYSINTGFSKGKYGKDHFLGANINGRVNGKSITVTCNHYL